MGIIMRGARDACGEDVGERKRQPLRIPGRVKYSLTLELRRRNSAYQHIPSGYMDPSPDDFAS